MTPTRSKTRIYSVFADIVRLSNVRRVLRQAWFASFALLGLGLGISPQMVAAQTLNQAIESALATYPQLQAAQAQSRAAQLQIERARAGYRPSVDVTSSAGRRTTDSPVVKPSQSLNETTLGVVLTQTLFDGGSVAREIDRQQALFEEACAIERDLHEQIVLNVTKVYIEVLKAQKLLALSEENVQTHLEFIGAMNTLVQADSGRAYELKQTQARLAQAESVKAARLARLREAQSSYLRVVGQLPNALIDLQTPEIAQSLEVATERAKKTNPLIAVEQARIRAAAQAAPIAKAAFLPRVQLELSANRNRNTSGIVGSFADQGAFVVARWNLYRGGADAANEKVAVQTLEAAKNNGLQTQRNVIERTALAWHELEGQNNSNRELGSQVQYSTETLSAYRDQFRISRRSMLDVLNSASELFLARSNLTAGQAEELGSAYELLAAQGTLSSTLNVSTPNNVASAKAQP